MKTSLKKEILAELKKLGCTNETLMKNVEIECRHHDIDISVCSDDFENGGYREPSDAEMEEVADMMTDFWQIEFQYQFDDACQGVGVGAKE